jgi:TatA/E family protein of Tat protein translocase
MFGKIGIGELILILAIALVIFGPKKLPELGKVIGEAIRNFRKHSDGSEGPLGDPEDSGSVGKTGTGPGPGGAAEAPRQVGMSPVNHETAENPSRETSRK